MADTDIAITAGTGTKIDTRTVGAGVDEHRQVVVVGDPTTAAGVAPVDATAGLKVDTELPVAAALSDTIANPTSPMVGAGGMFYNGTDWRRARQAPAGATNESPTGIGFGAIALHHAGGSGEYHPLKAASFEGPTSSGDSILVNHPYWYTGATFVRASGDATNGLDVDVTRIAAGTNTIGAVNVKPATSGGLSTFHLASAGSTNATNIKASAGQLFGWYIYNSNAAARKVAFHNTAGTPTAGASVHSSLVVPPLSAANVELSNGIAFGTGIAITTVTGLADNDTAAVAANDLIINIFYV